MLPLLNMRVEEYHCGDALFHIMNSFYTISAQQFCQALSRRKIGICSHGDSALRL